MKLIPKLCGSDVELAAFRRGSTQAADEAACAVLREIDGVPADGWRPHAVGAPASRSSYDMRIGSASGPNGFYGGSLPFSGRSYDPQDRERKFLPANGGCAYIDLGHLELCQPEVLSAFDHVACWHAMLRMAQRALDRASAREPGEGRITVLVNNSDGHGNSYGSHLNFLVSREAWNNIFEQKLHQLLYLAAYQASAIVFCGQGKVGSENGAPRVAYQLSQRADFMETLTGPQTTCRRPIVNSRDEPLCGARGGDAARLARMHVIFFDSTLCHVSSLLKVGATQIVLAMLEAGEMNPARILDSPLDALRCWSRDPTLQARARTASGEAVTAVELQRRFLEDAQRFVAGGACDEVVPRAAEIVALWEETLGLLERRDFGALASRIDWVLKLAVLDSVREQRGLAWDAPALKHLDHVYSSLDPSEGLYWAFEGEGRLMPVVTDAEIERFVTEPPEDTRAWTRAMLLRRAERTRVDEVDWDSVRLWTGRPWPRRLTVSLANPLAATRAEMAPVFERAGTPGELIDALLITGELYDSPAGARDGGERVH